MALDTRYRPIKYADVLGQKGTVQILRQFVKTGAGFHQSYLFAGPYGSGKTTSARILARALLCEQPVEGEPCDTCNSCLSLLENGSSENFSEVDAATNSGKADVKRITEEIEYATLSGRRRIYLFDECFTEDTVLLTRTGFRNIRDLVESRFQGEVLSFDPEKGLSVWKPLTDWFDLGTREVITLTFDNGVELTVTTNQELFTKNRGWVKASELTAEDDVEAVVFGLQQNTMAHLTHKSAPWHAPVYDVTVADTHSFFASSGPTPQSGVLAHNCHRLSADALDALLKPMEESVGGTEDKRLICILCTTEPERMKATILSRCAPAFYIEMLKPEVVADRLVTVCEAEGIQYERDALVLIAERTECHIRDCLKAVEGVSMLGSVSMDNVKSYLHLDLNQSYLDLLLALGGESFAPVSAVLRHLQSKASPLTCYERLAELCLMAYKLHTGLDNSPPSYWDRDALKRAGEHHGPRLVELASFFSSKPSKATYAALECDLLMSHNGHSLVATAMTVAVPVLRTAPSALTASPVAAPSPTISAPSASAPASAPQTGTVVVGGVKVDFRAQRRVEANPHPNGLDMLPKEFGGMVSRMVSELKWTSGTDKHG